MVTNIKFINSVITPFAHFILFYIINKVKYNIILSFAGNFQANSIQASLYGINWQNSISLKWVKMNIITDDLFTGTNTGHSHEICHSHEITVRDEIRKAVSLRFTSQLGWINLYSFRFNANFNVLQYAQQKNRLIAIMLLAFTIKKVYIYCCSVKLQGQNSVISVGIHTIGFEAKISLVFQVGHTNLSR